MIQNFPNIPESSEATDVAISQRLKVWVTAVILGVVASAVWDGVKVLLGFHFSVLTLHELLQLGYFLLVAGIGVYLGRKIGTPKSEPANRQIFFFSPGVAVTLNPGLGRIFLNLHIVSTAPAELIFIRIMVRDNKGTSVTCESSEPIMIGRLEVTAKTFEKQTTPHELGGFVPGAMVNLDGYAKFRDDDKITTIPIHISTIPSF